MNNYLAITIGPIYKTIQQARATREIWAASFVFSLMMKEILKQLDQHDKVATILNPAVSTVHENEWFHGAGIYPDRCQVQLKEGQTFTTEDMAAFRTAVFDTLLGGALKEQQTYFHIYAVQATYPAEMVNDPNLDTTKNVIHRLNKVMDNAELQVNFRQTGATPIIKKLTTRNNLNKLRAAGIGAEDEVFLADGEDKRLPSLIEISTQALKAEPTYKNLVTDVVWENLRRNDNNGNLTLAEEGILKTLKAEVKDKFRMHHKYYAIVQSDGDGIGDAITKVGNNPRATAEFSEKLMEFSKFAAGEIAAFGAIPVYIGGDDLLFIAPLVNEKAGVKETLFELMERLEANYKVDKTTMSYGIAISYYKYPMDKILDMAYDQLFKRAKKFNIRTEAERAANEKGRAKDAVAFNLRKGSGQFFGTMLPKRTAAYTEFLTLIKKAKNLEEAFVSSLIYTLEKHSYLLFDALEHQAEANFFEHHFNEKKESENEQFIAAIQTFTRKVFDTMENIETDVAWKSYLDKDEAVTKKSIIANTIYSCLRLLQLLNAKDHE